MTIWLLQGNLRERERNAIRKTTNQIIPFIQSSKPNLTWWWFSFRKMIWPWMLHVFLSVSIRCPGNSWIDNSDWYGWSQHFILTHYHHHHHHPFMMKNFLHLFLSSVLLSTNQFLCMKNIWQLKKISNNNKNVGQKTENRSLSKYKEAGTTTHTHTHHCCNLMMFEKKEIVTNYSKRITIIHSFLDCYCHNQWIYNNQIDSDKNFFITKQYRRIFIDKSKYTSIINMNDNLFCQSISTLDT